MAALRMQLPSSHDIRAEPVHMHMRLLMFICKQARCRRLVALFSSLEYDVRVAQFWVTLLRNQAFLFFLLHCEDHYKAHSEAKHALPASSFTNQQ